MKNHRFALLALIGIAAIAGATQAAMLAARVNGTAITLERLERYTEEYMREQRVNVGSIRNPERFKRIKREALDRLVDLELLWQAAKKEKVIVSDAEIEEQFKALSAQFPSPESFRERLRAAAYTEASYRVYLRESLSAQKYVNSVVAAKMVVSDAEVGKFYRENKEKMHRPEEIQARHILIQLDAKADAKAKDAARKKLEELAARARAGADFAELARKHSQDSTAAAGGDLGFFRHGMMVAPFEEAAFKLKPGEMSPVVETQFGLHLIRVEARRGGDIVSEDEAREPLRKQLQQQKGQAAFQELIEKLHKQAKIEILAPL